MKVFHFTLILLFLRIYLVEAQQQTDAGMWSTLSIEKDITKKFSVGLDQEVRLKNNSSRLSLLYTNVSAGYKINKGFKLGFGYRWIDKYEKEGYFSFKHRLMLDISCKYKISDLSLGYRSRIQSEIGNVYKSSLGGIPEWYWRNKFEIKYELNNFTPYINAEFGYQVIDSKNPRADYAFHRVRTSVGLDYKINKQNSIGIYYLNQQEFDIDDPSNSNILGLQYSISFGRNKNKDKDKDREDDNEE
jgi:long-subunit fatty acid transport protein